jgi:hypothetical protein
MRESTGLNEFCALSYFFVENAVPGTVYLDIPEEFLLPIFEEGPYDTVFREGMPRHSHKGVTDFLNGKLPEKWVGRWWA